jgi:hypothetical protein
MIASTEIIELAARWHAQSEPLSPGERRRLFSWVAEFVEHHCRDLGFFATLALALQLEEDSEWPMRLIAGQILDRPTATTTGAPYTSEDVAEILDEPVVDMLELSLERNRQLEAEVAIWKRRARITAEQIAKRQPQSLWAMWCDEPMLDAIDSWARITAWMRQNGWHEVGDPNMWLGAPAQGWDRLSLGALVLIPQTAGKMAVWRVICELAVYSKRGVWDVLDEILAMKTETAP